MNRSENLMDALRREMKSRGVKYQDLATKLDVSLATIKRCFQKGGDISLERLESLCVAVGIDFYDLVDLSKQNYTESSLTEEQEELLTDEKYLAAFFAATCKINKLLIKSFGGHTAEELERILRTLEENDLVERHRHGQLKSPFQFFTIRWIPNGPFERCYGKKFCHEYFKDAFEHNKHYSGFEESSGFSGFRQIYLTEWSLKILSQKMHDLFQEAIAMSNADLKNELDKVIAVGVMVSGQPWISDMLRRMYQPGPECDTSLQEQSDKVREYLGSTSDKES